jgi:hypothetical protein
MASIAAVTDAVSLAPSEMNFFSRLGGCQLLSETEGQLQGQGRSQAEASASAAGQSYKVSGQAKVESTARSSQKSRYSLHEPVRPTYRHGASSSTSNSQV